MLQDSGGSTLRIPLLPVSQSVVDDPVDVGESRISVIPSLISHSAVGAVDNHRRVQEEATTITREQLSHLTKLNDIESVRRLGGAEGIAARIHNTVSQTRSSRVTTLHDSPRGKDFVSAGAWVHQGFGMEAGTEDTRKQIYGSNIVNQKMGTGATLGNFFVDVLMEVFSTSCAM